jgi:hypothetical protein
VADRRDDETSKAAVHRAIDEDRAKHFGSELVSPFSESKNGKKHFVRSSRMHNTVDVHLRGGLPEAATGECVAPCDGLPSDGGGRARH